MSIENMTRVIAALELADKWFDDVADVEEGTVVLACVMTILNMETDSDECINLALALLQDKEWRDRYRAECRDPDTTH